MIQAERRSQPVVRARGLPMRGLGAGTKLTEDIKQIPGPLGCPVPASLIGVS